MRVMILGGNGFIGRNLAACLKKKGDSVLSFDISVPENMEDGIQYVKGNFFEEQDIIPYLPKQDVVVHAISSINPGNSNAMYMQGYNFDFVYSVRLAEYASQYGFRLLFLSSGGTIYGLQEAMPIKEETLALPINHYGNLKLCIENTYRIFHKQSKADIKIVRIANPYGPGQNFKDGVGFIDAALKSSLTGQPLHIFGDGEVIRDYIYIDDVCEMLACVMGDQSNEVVYNIGTGVGISLNTIVDMVKKLNGNLEVIYTATRAVDVPKMILDPSKIMRIFQSKCITVNEGIDRYNEYLKNTYSGISQD